MSIGAMITALTEHRPACREVLECASPLALSDGRGGCESGGGLAQSMTLARGAWRLDSLAFTFNTPRD